MQRREAQIRNDELFTGREAILDDVLQAWREASEREQPHALVVKDRRANLKLARKVGGDLDKQRRRVRDLEKRNTEALEDIRLATRLRGIEIAFPQIDVHLETKSGTLQELDRADPNSGIRNG